MPRSRRSCSSFVIASGGRTHQIVSPEIVETSFRSGSPWIATIAPGEKTRTTVSGEPAERRIRARHLEDVVEAGAVFGPSVAVDTHDPVLDRATHRVLEDRIARLV